MEKEKIDVSPLHSSMKKKAAFTLAEVLITLGIIGVVAALVIPFFVRKYQYQVFATQLAENYSIISNALKMAENDYGPQRNLGSS